MTARLNYVIGAYFGPRGHADPRYEKDRTVLVAAHLASLRRLSHSLHQVTLVVSGETTPAVDPFLAALPATVGGADLVVLRRPNVGMSYGAFSDAFARWGSEFTHYILTEDDYLFTQHDFDQRLVDELGRRPSCGFLCGAQYISEPHGRPHAAVFVGIASAAALTDAARVSGGLLPHDHASSSPSAGYYGQTEMSFAFLDAGYTLEDWLPLWSTAFWDSAPAAVRWFGRREDAMDPRSARGDFDKPAFVVPFQAVGQRARISDGRSWHAGVIREDGSCAMEPPP